MFDKPLLPIGAPLFKKSAPLETTEEQIAS
jgi:hypothetical protein